MKKNTITKLIATATAVLLCGLSLTGCTNGEKKDDETIKVTIVQPMSHTSLDQIRDTITSELENSGKNIEVVSANANGDSSAVATIIANLQSDGTDIVIPISTAPAQSAKSAFEGSDVPIVFAAVSNPKEAGLIGDDCKNITGVSNSIPSAEIVKLISRFQPDYKKIGFLYTSSETNSVSTINAAKAYCDENGIAYEEASISNVSEIQTAIETLISKGVDALYTGNDNTIASAMATYTDIAYSRGIPVYCGADSMVADGGFATVGVDYVQLSKQVADMVIKIVDGESPADMPYETLNEYAQYINLEAAEKLNFEPTDEMLDGFKVLVEKDGTSHFGE